MKMYSQIDGEEVIQYLFCYCVRREFHLDNLIVAVTCKYELFAE